VLRQALGERGRERFDRFFAAGPVALLTNPLIGLAAYGVVIIGTHLTHFMDAMATHSWLMPLEQVLYVGSGFLLLLTLIGDEPVRWRPPYLARILLLLLAMVPDTVVGIVLLQSSHVLFPTFLSMRPGWAPDAVADQQIAGGLMWAAGDGLMMTVAVAVVIFMISDTERGGVLGPWLESVRRQTLADHVGDDRDSRELDGAGATPRAGIGGDADVDADEDVLDAYNRMLARLSDQERRTP
jgi:putative copper resistance protein D